MKTYLIQKYDSDKGCFEETITKFTEEEINAYSKVHETIDILVDGESINIFEKGTIIEVMDKYRIKHKARIKELTSVRGLNNSRDDGYVLTYFDQNHEYNHFYSVGYLKKYINKK
jgi:uncharacterized ubiquitin-like protein YukD